VLKMHKKRLGIGLCPNPLRFPIPLARLRVAVPDEKNMESRTGWRREGTSHFYKLIALHPSTCFSIRVSLMRTSRQTEPARPTPGIHRNDNKVSPSTTLRRSYRCRQLIRKTQSRDAPAKSTRSEVAVASSRPLRRRSLAAVNRGRAGSVRQATHSSEGNHRRADGQR